MVGRSVYLVHARDLPAVRTRVGRTILRLREDVYDEVVRRVLKTFYHRRCGVVKDANFAGVYNDPLPCHSAHATLGPAVGEPDHGIKSLTGGWHAGGQYVYWAARTLVYVLRAFEHHPAVFRDGDVNIPEFANGVPDLLDEIRWELDFLFKMQLPDGSVLNMIHDGDVACGSPPSADRAPYYYYGPTIDSTGAFTAIMAMASRAYSAQGQLGYAATLKTAALNAWSWLLAQGDDDYKVWAAAELFRLNDTLVSARDYVDNYQNWATSPLLHFAFDTQAAITYLQTPQATTAVVDNMRNRIGGTVDEIFTYNDLYRNGMASGSYHSGSNRVRMGIGLLLLTAAELNATGSHSAAECVQYAQEIYHYFHGQNAMSMTYLSNMALWGADHSAYQVYDEWFGMVCNAFSPANFVGKPKHIFEPAYPYFVSDDDISPFGPLPGLVPGGPNTGYSGGVTPPANAGYDNLYYRDTCQIPQSYQFSENFLPSQGFYLALGSHFVSTSSPDLAIQLATDRHVAQTGETVTFTATYLNRGSLPVTDVRIQDQLSNGFSYVSSSPLATDLGGSYQWSLSTLAAGATGTVSLTANISSAATALEHNTFEIWGTGHPALESNEITNRTLFHGCDSSELDDNGSWAWDTAHVGLSYATTNCSQGPGCLAVVINDTDQNSWSTFTLVGARPVNWCAFSNGYLLMDVYSEIDPSIDIRIRLGMADQVWQVVHTTDGEVTQVGMNYNVTVPLDFSVTTSDPCTDPITAVSFVIAGTTSPNVVHIDNIRLSTSLP